ncbi:MAG: hypothetical protein ACRDGL_07545 [Candidatus Limnocylindrales bacterium]
MKPIEARARGDVARGAVVIDCPWCGSAIRSRPEAFAVLFDLTCGTCLTTVGLDLGPADASASRRASLAA